MNENRNIVLEKQKRRYELILELWKKVNGKEYTDVNFWKVADNLGFSKDEATEIYHYLMNEGFFSSRRAGGGVSLSHRAIVEIENSISNPQQSTEHFPATVIQNFNAPVGSVQNGNHSISNVNQNIGQNFSEILEQLAIIRSQFQSSSVADKEDFIDIVNDLEKEIIKENPNKSKIKGFLTTTKDFAVKTGTELAATTLAKLIESQIGIKG